MFTKIHSSKAGRLFSAAVSIVAVVAILSISLSYAPQQAAALTAGKTVPQSFPRVAMWWPSSTAPLTDVAKLDYAVPYEWQPMHPNTSRLATLRSLNSQQTIFADASTCELNYRQPDASGNPQGVAAYDAERIGAVPTSWILKAVGSTLAVNLTATTGKQSITVADGTKFKVGNLAIVDDEKVLVQAVSGNTLTVLRGWAGSSAAAHASGARIAAAVSSWAYSVKLDLTDDCPQGRATGEIATPGTGTENARSWMVRRTASHARAAGFDGVAIDLGLGYISWFKGDGNVGSFQSIASRSNPDVAVDYTAFDVQWAAGLAKFHADLRSQLGPDAAIVVNEATPAFGSINGSRIEGFPTSTTVTKDWYRKVVGPNKPQYPSYLDWCANALQPNYTTMQTYGTSATDYKLMRFGLTTALMGDGFYAYKVAKTNTIQWYDEYDNAGAGKGYLGQPTSAMRSVMNLSSPDLFSGTGAYNDSAALSAWSLYNRSGYASTTSLDSGAMKIACTQSAGTIGGVEIKKSNVSLTANTKYTLSFRVRADRDMNIQATSMLATSPYTNYMSSSEVPVSTTWRTVELPMVSTGTDAAAIVKFLMGKSTGTIWLDDVKLQSGDRNVYRRDFANGIALVNASDSAATVDLGGTFRKIKGTQDPVVNDGSLVTKVTIPANDGIVLLREAQVAQPPVATEPTQTTTVPTSTMEPTVTIPVTTPVTTPTTVPTATVPPTTTVPTVTVPTTATTNPTTTTPTTRPTRPRKTRVSLKVTYKSTALRSASVTFVKVSTGRKYTVRTNRRGRVVKTLTQGTYRLKVRYKGKTRLTKTVKFAKSKVTKRVRVRSVH